MAPRGRQRLPTAGSDEKRERILKAAEALFDRYGYANTTIEQIVQALGVTKPFVYYYFRNKQEIFETLCWAPTEACFTVLDFAADDPRPAHEKAIDGLQRLIAATIAHYPAGFFPYREPQAFSPAYLKASRNVAQQFYKQFCALLDEGRASAFRFPRHPHHGTGGLQSARLSLQLVSAWRQAGPGRDGGRAHRSGLARAGPAHCCGPCAQTRGQSRTDAGSAEPFAPRRRKSASSTTNSAS